METKTYLPTYIHTYLHVVHPSKRHAKKKPLKEKTRALLGHSICYMYIICEFLTGDSTITFQLVALYHSI